MVFASGPVGVWLGRGAGHERLAGQDNVACLLLLCEMVRDVRVVGLHIPDEAAQIPLRLKILSGEVRHEFQGPIEDIGRC
jgi:hypothetical protein